MEFYYLDTSAAAKRYIAEPGSAWIRSILDSASLSLIVSSRLLRVEMISAFTRRHREGILNQSDYDTIVAAFYDDCVRQYHLAGDDDPVLDLACALMERHPLRAYDAVHLATALVAERSFHTTGLPALLFLSSDDRLLDAARTEGLSVDNPSAHP